MGPEGGSGGGTVVAEGTPESVAQTAGSYTGEFLVDLLPRPVRNGKAPAKAPAKSAGKTPAKARTRKVVTPV
ncbi:UvrABC system protein A [Mycobacteroides abscessus]|nr:UvrABC system protein A [Mycobacteroides abscessus]